MFFSTFVSFLIIFFASKPTQTVLKRMGRALYWISKILSFLDSARHSESIPHVADGAPHLDQKAKRSPLADAKKNFRSLFSKNYGVFHKLQKRDFSF